MYRPAVPGDGPEMLRLIEAHPAGKGMQILYTRRPDAYTSYRTECPGAEMILCVNDDNRVLAQAVCLPRKLYINREAHMVGYVTGLRKTEGAAINIMKMLEAGRTRSSVSRFFCSFLDENKPIYDLFAKRGLVRPVCGYTTYFLNPAVFKPSKHNCKFRRAAPGDTEKLVNFYNMVGSEYSYFPVFRTMNDFAGLTVSDFFLLEAGDEVIAAGALWDQRAYKQYIVLGFYGAYKLAAYCNPLLRFFCYPPLPKKNMAANFAYISFLLCRKDNPDMAHVFLGELAAAAGGYDFLTIGAVSGSELAAVLNSVRSIKIDSRLCVIDHDKNGPAAYKTPLRFECALL